MNAAVTDKEKSRRQLSLSRSQPFADDGWTARTVKELGLEHTTRTVVVKRVPVLSAFPCIMLYHYSRGDEIGNDRSKVTSHSCISTVASNPWYNGAKIT
ncbi:MAG: hypothetical protein ABSH20_28360 [Tepidisphaeraceae bacterium]